MKYLDKVYGQVKIGEPLVLEIIKTPSFRRLKGIDQLGYPSLCNPHSLSVSQVKHTRFQHSLGVFILLRKFDTSFEEQTAGLIHDLSHAAFSHCIDYVLDGGSETEHSYQDNIFGQFVRKTEIPDILKKYNLEPDYILNEHNFPLLEKKLPDLCADRIDYSLRTAYHFGELDKNNLNSILSNLMVSDNNWIFRNYKSAKKFAQLFFKINRLYYSGFPSAVMFRTIGDVIRYSFKKRYISKGDLWTTDKEVLEKIKKHQRQDKKLNLLLRRMNNKTKFENNPKDYHTRVFCKSRIVDPLFKKGDSIIRLSETDRKWADIVKKESQPKEYFIKFID